MEYEIDIQGKPDLITTPSQESSLSSIGNLFTLQDGRPHTVRIAISGTTITMIILVTICLLCYWRKNPNCCSRVFTTCHATCSRRKQIQRATLIDNVLNTIQQELNSSLQATPLEMAQFQVAPNRVAPPTPPELQLWGRGEIVCMLYIWVLGPVCMLGWVSTPTLLSLWLFGWVTRPNFECQT